MNWKAFAAGLIIGIAVTWTVLASVGIWSLHLSNEGHAYRINKVTGKVEIYAQGWRPMK